MTPAKPASRITRVRAHGVAFDLYDDADLPGLPCGGTGVSGPASAIWHDPAGIEERRWDGAEPKRTREMQDGDRLLLTVDHDVERGHLLRAPGIGAVLVSEDGLEVRCAPEQAAPDWQVLLIGQVLPLVSTLRGYEVFHAAGVVLGNIATFCAHRPESARAPSPPTLSWRVQRS